MNQSLPLQSSIGVCHTASSSPYNLQSPGQQSQGTPQSVYQASGSPGSIDSPESRYAHLSPVDCHDSHQQQYQDCGTIPPPGLHPALYLYAQYTNTSPTINYTDYIQRNN